jgi:HK97 family phage major capsid protein
VSTRIDELTAAIGDLVAQREAALNEADTLSRNTDPTTEQSERFDALMTQVDELDGKRKAVEAQVDKLRQFASARDAQAALAAQYAPAPAAPGGRVDARPKAALQVSEPSPYRRGGPANYFADLWHYQMAAAGRNADPDPTAIERMAGHARQMLEVRNDVSTSSLGGLVPVQYLIDEFAPVVSAGRPFANAVRRRPLPDLGMSFTIPRGNTATRVDWQASENTALTERDYGVSDLSVPMRTLIGGVDISTQAIKRGATSVEIHAADLVEQYVMALDANLYNGTGTNGQHWGLLSTTGVTRNDITVTTAIQQWKQIGKALADIHTARMLPPDLIVMHPRRAAYFQVATDTTLGRPLITPTAGYGPDNVIGQLNLASGGQIIGEMHGVPVMVDANIPTTLSYDVTAGSTTDLIVVTRRSDLILMEDEAFPMAVQFDEVLSNQLSSRLVIYGFSAFTAGRYPTATRVLAGSGLTTPVWT